MYSVHQFRRFIYLRFDESLKTLISCRGAVQKINVKLKVVSQKDNSYSSCENKIDVFVSQVALRHTTHDMSDRTKTWKRCATDRVRSESPSLNFILLGSFKNILFCLFLWLHMYTQGRSDDCGTRLGPSGKLLWPYSCQLALCFTQWCQWVSFFPLEW